MVLSGLKCNLNELTFTSYSCDMRASWTGAWFILSLWRCICVHTITRHQYACVTWFLEPQPDRWLCYCHLTADMTCATGHAVKLLWCDTTWLVTLTMGRASCFCQTWKIKKERKLHVIPPGLAASTGKGIFPHCSSHPCPVQLRGWGCDVLGGCYQLRKLYSSEVALKKSVWALGIPRTTNTSVKNEGIHLN